MDSVAPESCQLLLFQMLASHEFGSRVHHKVKLRQIKCWYLKLKFPIECKKYSKATKWK